MTLPFADSLRLAVALLIGLLIGLDRERAEQRKQADLFAGIRTFPLIALIGAIPALELQSWGPIPLIGCFLALAALTTVAYSRSAAGGHIGATTETAALVTFLLGALAGTGQLLLAGGVGIAVALLLNAKPRLERFSRTLDQDELDAALELLVISGIVLPLLPNRGFGPWQVWNPFEIWLVVVLVSAVSFAGFVAVRWFGQSRGLLASGVIGALVSSTAVTVAMAGRSREDAGAVSSAAVATILASAVMGWRVLFFAAAGGGEFVARLLPVVLVMTLVGGLAAWLVARRSAAGAGGQRAAVLANPFSLKAALSFAFFYALVLLAMPAAREWLGASGNYLAAAVSSLVDVDAVTIAFARSDPGPAGWRGPAAAVSLAVLINTAVKLGIVLVLGERGFRRRVTLGLLAMAAAGAVAAMAVFQGGFRRGTLAFLAGLAGLLGLACAEAPRGPRDARDVILISIDTLRADHLPLYGYPRPTAPNLERRFRDGAVFLRAHATEASTGPSVASLLSGRLPQEHRVRMLYQLVPPGIDLVVDHLPGSYQKAAFVSNAVLSREAFGIAGRFDHYDDFVDQREPRRRVYERNAERTADALIDWLNSDLDPERPLFLWVHFIDPHGPYRPPPGRPAAFDSPEEVPIDPKRVPGYTRVPEQRDGTWYVDRYDEEIAYTDAQIERVLRAYEEGRPLEQALLIVTADHGESMMEHESWFTHSYHVYEEIARVPLLVRAPGLAPARVERRVSGIDVAPTILRFAGAAVPPHLAGFDLLAPEALPEDRVVFCEAAQAGYQVRAALRGAEKWLVAERADGRRGRWSYDLSRDPGELAPRRWSESPGPAALDEWIRSDPDPRGVPLEYRAGAAPKAPKLRPGLPADELELLRGLGYAAEEDARPDPEPPLVLPSVAME